MSYNSSDWLEDIKEEKIKLENKENLKKELGIGPNVVHIDTSLKRPAQNSPKYLKKRNTDSDSEPECSTPKPKVKRKRLKKSIPIAKPTSGKGI